MQDLNQILSRAEGSAMPSGPRNESTIILQG